MANPEHLKILKQGVDAWNEWREEDTEILPDLSSADLVAANLTEANLSGAKLVGADLAKADLVRADLGGADLTQACLSGADLTLAHLSGAHLGGAYLSWAYLARANLGHADLIGADLFDADLVWADLHDANLGRADLSAAHLGGANLDNSDFTNAQVGRTVFGNNDLSTVKGLETVKHAGPSTIGIDTIYKSKGNIPEVFLRGCGVPEDFIVYMRSLVSKAIDYYSCFISYSSKDDAFAQRLHADLQQKGVRCWFAPEDLKIGDKFRMRIDESIRVYDKLMVILSVNSIRSPWVEKEVEVALEKERKQNKLVLFPTRLDNAVMETDQAWAASLRRARHIGDFRAWKDHAPYQKSFDRLLRDLKAG
jgi:hypothetical protein